MATTVNLGKVMITPKGVYSPSTSYERLDVVTYGGSAFIALQPVQGVTPVAGEFWGLLVSKGDKGDKGDTGNTGSPPTITSQVIEYQVGASGTNVPTGAWSSSVPTVPQGSYLWVRTTITFQDSSPILIYTVSRFGTDGTGTASDLTPQALSYTPSAGTSSSLSRSDHVHPVPALKFTSFSGQSWTSGQPHVSDTDVQFPYRYSIPCSGVTSSMFAEVTFGVTSAMSGLYSPISDCGTNVVYIWASEQTAPTILSIFVHK